jgi:hypothetical protein
MFRFEYRNILQSYLKFMINIWNFMIQVNCDINESSWEWGSKKIGYGLL